jgi:hypothetical protein
VCSSDGIADPVADQYRRHERANISTDDVGADLAIADIPRDTIAHDRRRSLPSPYQRPCISYTAPTDMMTGGTFAWGALGSNECPANYFHIVDEGACRSAAAAAGKAYPYSKSETDASRPKGCYAYYFSGRGTYVVNLNMHPTGGIGGITKLLCSGARDSLLGTHKGTGLSGNGLSGNACCSHDAPARSSQRSLCCSELNSSSTALQ